MARVREGLVGLTDQRDDRQHRYLDIRFDQDFAQDPALGRLDLDLGLVGLHGEQEFALVDRIALILVPGHNGGFLDRLSQLR